MDVDALKAEIIQLCKFLNAKQMLAAGDGNLSVKLDESRVLVTAAGCNKAFLTKSDFAIVGLEGALLEGAKPSTELEMHLSVYDCQPKAKAVVHAHPPHAIGYSVVHPYALEMPTGALPEVVLGVGKIPIVPYAKPGTKQLAENIYTVVRHGSRALIMARHGAIAWGGSLMEAYNGIERIEHAAYVLACASNFGEAKALPDSELLDLRKSFEQRGGASL